MSLRQWYAPTLAYRTYLGWYLLSCLFLVYDVMLYFVDFIFLFPRQEWKHIPFNWTTSRSQANIRRNRQFPRDLIKSAKKTSDYANFRHAYSEYVKLSFSVTRKPCRPPVTYARVECLNRRATAVRNSTSLVQEVFLKLNYLLSVCIMADIWFRVSLFWLSRRTTAYTHVTLTHLLPFCAVSLFCAAHYKMFCVGYRRACLGGAVDSAAVRAVWLRWSASLDSRPSWLNHCIRL